MSNVFLKCDDHLNRFNQIIQATRYCSECNKACCDTCVIDFHIEHIIHAKTRIDEYLVNVAIPERVAALLRSVPNADRYNQNQLDALVSAS